MLKTDIFYLQNDTVELHLQEEDEDKIVITFDSPSELTEWAYKIKTEMTRLVNERQESI